MTESEEKKSTRSRGINARQSQILDFIRQYIFNNGYPPSVREIGSAVGLSSSASVHNNLKKLAEAGFVSWDPEKPRTYGLREEISWRKKSMVPVPLVGAVHAGDPMLAVENIEDTYPIPLDLIGCSGDSMKNAGILDHDYVFVRKQNYATNGDIVVALLNGEETTIKRYFRELKQIRLQPENDTMEPILVHEGLQILGKVFGVFRLYE